MGPVFYSLFCCHSVLGIVALCCLHIAVFSYAVQWPSGKYGLPMAMTGCPKANGFSWGSGYVYQDLENKNSLTATSAYFHLRAVVTSSGDVGQSFCMKTNKSGTTDNGRPNWPFGNYCIYKKGSSCPKGLSQGWVLWDDENGKNGVNMNFHNGSVPSGKYNQDTKIFFCCQTVGSTGTPVELPIDKPFYLIAYNNKNCQEVLKTTHTLEFIRYDTENDKNHDGLAHPYPYGADSFVPYIYYCYYQACRWTKTALQGTFWSPNYPFTYKNNAWCEWYITVPSNYIIVLAFDDFQLENIDMCVTQTCECDYVEVRDIFPNGTSLLIGTYCMGVAYPYGNIKSRGNNVTVIFRSDKSIGRRGFKARYQAIQISTATSVARTTQGVNGTNPTIVSTVIPTSVLSTTFKGPTNNSSTSTGLSSSTSHKGTTELKPTSPSMSSSTKTTSEARTLSTNQRTTSTLKTKEPAATRPNGKSTKRTTTEQDLSTTGSSTDKEPTNNSTTVNAEGLHQATRNSDSGNVYTIVAVSASLIVIAGVVVLTIFCFCKRRNPKRNRKIIERRSLTVSFTATEWKYGVSNMIPCDVYAGSEEHKEKDERYNDVTQQTLNILYENRASLADSMDGFVRDDEIKLSDNPLYSSSAESEQDNNDVIYDSVDDVATGVKTAEAEYDNPVFEGVV